MGKQHDTFPNEQPEMPVPKETPEINQPSDPKETPEINQPSDLKEPEAPQEDPQIVPDEFPPEEIHREQLSRELFNVELFT
jgi:hypothetical protein